MIEKIKKHSEWKKVYNQLITEGKTIGFVPTMGAFHNGHLSLIERSAEENDITLVSIFINPTQFNNPNDLKKYPTNFEDDFEILNKIDKVNYLFLPDYDLLYADNFRYKVTEDSISKILCGKHRPGHFDGVLTVVMKLLNIIKPDNAYFGEKDFQQYILIKDMINSFFMDINVVPCITVREKSGLAMSSRNKRLSPKTIEKASIFHKLLKSKIDLPSIVSRLESNKFKVDYVEELDGRRFGAVIIDNIRLIDNVII